MPKKITLSKKRVDELLDLLKIMDHYLDPYWDGGDAHPEEIREDIAGWIHDLEIPFETRKAARHA